MNNLINKCAIAAIAIVPIASNAMDMGLNIKAKGGLDMYNSMTIPAGGTINGYGFDAGLSAGVVLSDMFTIGVEGGFARSFMQTISDTGPLHDKKVLRYNLPYIIGSATVNLNISDSFISPYFGIGAGVVFANLDLSENDLNLGSNTPEFEYNANAVFTGEVGVEFALSDNLKLGAGYKLMGNFSDITYKETSGVEKVEHKLMKQSLLGSVSYTIDFSDK